MQNIQPGLFTFQKVLYINTHYF